jgi:aspartyl/asparaginyl-tRNA synthetase
MTRVLNRDVAKNAGKEVEVQGWLHKKRLLGGLNFIVLRDRSGLLQMVVDKSDEVEKLRGMQLGTILTVTGKVVKEQRAPGGAELHEVQIAINVPVTYESPIEIDKPLSHKPENLDTLFEYRPIGLRNLQETAIFKVQSAITRAIREHNDAELKTLNATKPKLTKEIPSMSMTEIHEKYSKETGTNTVGEKDLRPDEERFICEYAKKNLSSEAVFVTDWPASEMKFYHKAQPNNPELADRIDLLFRGVEIVTGSMRENNYEIVEKQLREQAGGDPNDPGFRPLLQAMQAGMPPHGGFGMGLERLTQKFLGLANVKEATLFPRDINRLSP